MGVEAGIGKSNGDAGGNGDGGFEIHDSTMAVDWNKYHTGTLTDQTGFVTVPEGNATSDDGSPNLSGGNAFRYSDTLIGEPGESHNNGNPVADLVFSSTGNLASDTMSRLLRDELEGIDFYIAQGYVEIARDTLDRLREENGDHPEVLSRYKRLGVSFDNDAAVAEEKEENSEPAKEEATSTPAGTVFLQDLPEYIDENTTDAVDDLGLTMSEVDAEAPASEALMAETVETAGADTWISPEGEAEKVTPFLIQKESGPLYKDLVVQFNTSDLLKGTEFAAHERAVDDPSIPAEASLGTADLIDSIVSNIDSSFDIIEQPSYSEAAEEVSQDVDPASMDSAEGVEDYFEDTELVEEHPTEMDLSEIVHAADYVEATEVVAAEEVEAIWKSGPLPVEPVKDELQVIFDELKENTGGLKPLHDFETHYSLGLAYKDMDLLDDAISEFQMAFRMAGMEDLKGDYIHCCNMLGVCFKRKQLPKVSIMWFQRGLRIPNRSEDEYQALKFEIGLCYEEMGELDKAIDVLMEVYGTDVSYREVGKKLKQLQAAKNG